jgi:hypothetical protein
MQWYVYLVTVFAMAVFGWLAFDFLGRPLQALLELRRKILQQTLVLGDITPPKPREQAVSSREINEYNQTMKNVRQAQRTFQYLASQLLAFAENETATCNALAAIGWNIVAAGSHLTDLSVGYSHVNRADLCHQIKKALGSTDAAEARLILRLRKLGWSDLISSGRWHFLNLAENTNLRPSQGALSMRADCAVRPGTYR